MKTTRWKTKIADTSENLIAIRGYDLTELMGAVSFGEMFYLLARGEVPSKAAGKVIDAMLVSCADHGIITTSVAARYAIASGTPMQGALAAGVLMIGDVYGGAVEQAARYFHETLERHGDRSAQEIVTLVLADMAQKPFRVPGYGHPLHGDGDPRSRRLLEIAREQGVAGRAVALASEFETRLGPAVGRPLPLNADGALAVLAIDLGFDWRFTRAFMLMARTAGILAHADEERREGKPWRYPPPAEHQVETHGDYYDGVPLRRLGDH